MIRLKVFVSSVQKEMENERRALKAYLRDDALLSRFFDVFLFEDLPAVDRRADAVYLAEVGSSDIYVALLGNEYGSEDKDGISPTHREFCEATRLGKHRLVFVKGATDSDKHPKMQALIAEAGAQLIRRRFLSSAELLPSIYASLVDFLAARQLLRFGPFDATPCPDATMEDLSSEKIRLFLGIARRARVFPLSEDTLPVHVLEHLNLLKNGLPTNAAVLLFGNKPQRFLISSEVKCAHFHGTDVRKPIPFYQVYKGTAFDLVDQAVDFVLSKINLAVGTRERSNQAPVAYEMPPEVVREAIVNAVAHRDYTSNGSVQVMLFSDRLEVWNPGNFAAYTDTEKAPASAWLGSRKSSACGIALSHQIHRTHGYGSRRHDRTLPQFRPTGTGILPDGRFRYHHPSEAGAGSQSGHPSSHSTSHPPCDPSSRPPSHSTSRGALALIGFVRCFEQYRDPERTWPQRSEACG